MNDTPKYSRETMSLAPELIETKRLRLRPMDYSRDKDGFIKMRSDPRVMEFIGIPAIEDYNACAKEADTKNANGDFKFFYAITDRSLNDDQMIGLVIMRPTPEGDTIEVGYWLMPDYWGKGLVTEAAKAVCEHCPDTMGFPKSDISALVTVGHTASRNVLEKVGLKITHIGPYKAPNYDAEVEEVWFFRWAG